MQQGKKTRKKQRRRGKRETGGKRQQGKKLDLYHTRKEGQENTSGPHVQKK